MLKGLMNISISVFGISSKVSLFLSQRVDTVVNKEQRRLMSK